MLLTLIAEVTDDRGRAGPFVSTNSGRMLLRDWLGQVLAQMAERDTKRQALVQRVATDLARARQLPADPVQAQQAIDDEVANRVCAAAKTNVSRAVSELVKAGLLRRYYAGFAVDHQNRGGQRHAVYSLDGPARLLVGRATHCSENRRTVQAELPF